MLFCFYGICLLFHLVNVQCIKDREMTTETDGSEDEVDGPKTEYKYFNLLDYYDYLEGMVEADADDEKLRAMLKEISYTHNSSNAAESFEDFAADAINFVNYKPADTVDIQNWPNEVVLNKDKPSVVKDIQRRNLDEINTENTVPIDIQSILSNVAFGRSNMDEINTEETVPIDIQSILNNAGFSKYQPIEPVTMDVQNVFNEDEFNENVLVEKVVKDMHRMNLDEMEFNKYQPAETLTIDMQSGILNDNEDIYVETITIVLPIDTTYHYSSYRRTAGLIGVIITLILAPFVIYQRCNAKKELKLRVFVIKSKPEKNKPLISV